MRAMILPPGPLQSSALVLKLTEIKQKGVLYLNTKLGKLDFILCNAALVRTIGFESFSIFILDC